MTEYYRDPYDFSQIYKVTYAGKLYKLNIDNGLWDNVSETIDFDPNWDSIPFYMINAYCLKIYSNKSANYFAEHKQEVGINHYEYGTHFDYYFVNKEVFAVDERRDLYKCAPEIMVPKLQKVNLIPDNWHELVYAEAIDYIKNQNGIFLADMELYYDDLGNIQGFTKDLKQFCLNIKTGQLNEVYDDIGIDPNWKDCKLDDPVFKNNDNLELMLTSDEYESLTSLHQYIVKSENIYKEVEQKHPFGKEFNYFMDPYGRIIAEDENKFYYNCDYDFMKPAPQRDSVDDCWEIIRFDVMELIEEYERYLEALPTMKMTLIHTINFVSDSDNNIVYSRDQRGKWYVLNNNTGDLDELPEKPEIGENSIVLDKVQSLKLKGMCKVQNNS